MHCIIINIKANIVIVFSNTSICYTYQQLKYSSPNRSKQNKKTMTTQKSLPFGKWRFREKEVRRMGQKQKRTTGLSRRTREERIHRKVGSNWQPWDSRRGGRETSEIPGLPSGVIPWVGWKKHTTVCKGPNTHSSGYLVEHVTTISTWANTWLWGPCDSCGYSFSFIFIGCHACNTSKPALTEIGHPPKTECGCLHGGVIENGHTCNPLTLWTVPVLVQVWVHILGDPQCSAEERYNNNNGDLSLYQVNSFALWFDVSIFWDMDQTDLYKYKYEQLVN